MRSRTLYVGKTIRWVREGIIYSATILSCFKDSARVLVESDDLGLFYVLKDQII